MSAWQIVLIVLVVGFIAFAVERSVRVHRRQVTTGREELVGKTAVTRTPLNPQGQVIFKGEIWEALSVSGHLGSGIPVIITRVDGLILHVREA